MRRRASALAGCAILAGALSPARGLAQGGETSAIVLELPASARALALGGAYAAIGGDDASIFYNPGQLAAAPRRAAGVSLQRYLESSTLGAVSGAIQLGPGVIGIGVLVLDYGSADEFVPDPDFGGERGEATGRSISASEIAGSVGYATTWRGVRVGAAVKYVQQRVVDVSGGAAAFDVGAGYDGPYGLSFGAAVQNLGGSITLASGSAPLPRLFRLGVTRALAQVGRFEMLGVAELSQARSGDMLPAGGTEITWTAANGMQVMARLGALPRSDDAASSRWALGGGLRARSLAVDYAYQSFDALSITSHRLGVRWWK